jgi:hypothetical protein
MIDFIKAKILINPRELLNNKLLNFFRQMNPETGEIKTVNRKNKIRIPYQTATYLDLEFRIYDYKTINKKRIYPGNVYLIGSLHKFWNNGAHNYNDFDLNGLHYVLNELKTKFNIYPHQLILQQVEIGINIQPPCKSERIIDHCFIHRSQSFKTVFTPDEGSYIQVQHSQYLIKIYDKRKHYSGKGFQIDSEILRFEIKYLKMEKLNKMGIFTLQDLLKYGLEKFIPVLLDEWKQVLFYDFTINSKSQSILNYKNPLYWKELINNKRNSALNKHKGKLKNIVFNHSENIQEQITKLIKGKGEQLVQGGAGIDSIYKVSNFVPQSKSKVCNLTGYNIEMQKEDSILLSHSGLRYYYNTNRKVYNSVKIKYLSNKWQKTDLKTEIKEIAHNIRNTINNRKLKQKKIYPENHFRLFEIN